MTTDCSPLSSHLKFNETYHNPERNLSLQGSLYAFFLLDCLRLAYMLSDVEACENLKAYFIVELHIISSSVELI